MREVSAVETAVYGYSWNDDMRFMIDAVSAEEARERFESGPWFSVSVGNGLLTTADAALKAEATGRLGSIPEFTLEVTPGATDINTFFYDAHGSVKAIYEFDRVDHRTMFLSTFILYEYPDESRWYGQNESVVTDNIRFRQDGTSRHRHNDKRKELIEAIDRKDVNLAKNWESVPQFGDWFGFGRPDRRPGVA